MKCTDFWEKEKELKRTALRELAEAVKAHGGKYEWTDEDGLPLDGSDMPCVCVFMDYGPTDVIIHSVEYDKEGHWAFIGESTDRCCPQEIIFDDPRDIANAYHIQTITENIPETEEVKDATVPQPQVVSLLDQDDLKQRGFDGSNTTNEQLAQIASKMNDYYLDYSFWDDMEEACRYLDVPRIKEEPENDEEE